MYVMKRLPVTHYTKVSNKLFTYTELSEGAKLMYVYLCSLSNGKDISDEYLVKVLGIGIRSVYNRKKELKACGLIATKQVAPRVYELYIGNPDYSASRVKADRQNEKRENK